MTSLNKCLCTASAFELVEKVFPKIESGEVKPTIHAVLPITEAEAAHDILYKGQNVGKVVLMVK